MELPERQASSVAKMRLGRSVESAFEVGMNKLTPITTGRESLADLVFESVRDAIVARRFGPGDRVTEAGIAEELQVSKTPVREAFFRLQHVGLLESDGRRGGRIAIASPAGIRHAYEVRVALEVEAARIVADRGEDDDLESITYFAHASHEAASQSDVVSFRTMDRQLHFAIAEATGNPRLTASIKDAFDLTWTLRKRDVPVADDSVACAVQHVNIARALNSRDVDGAELEMRGHLKKVRDLVLDAFTVKSA